MICIYIYFFSFFFPWQILLVEIQSTILMTNLAWFIHIVWSWDQEKKIDKVFFASACEISQTGREILVAFRAITPILAKQTETVDKAIFRIRKNKRKKWKRREKNRRRKERNDDSTTGWLRILSLLEGLDGVMALRLTVKIW